MTRLSVTGTALRSKGLGAVALTLGLALLLGCDWDPLRAQSPSEPGTGRRAATASQPNGQARLATSPKRPFGLLEVRVVRVLDGDTIVVEGGITVRYIGIDTPETVHPTKPAGYFGKEASQANRRAVAGGVVALEFGIQRDDRYGRTLAYVWLGETLLNGWLVEKGFAKVTTFPPNVKYAEYFTRLQRTARDARRGLWNEPR